MPKPKIYLSVTTYKSNWRRQFKDVKRLGVREVSLFPTTLAPKQRQEFYKFLEKSGVESVLHVHLRHDCKEEEAQWLIDVYGVKYFTVHFLLLEKFSSWKIAKKICVENNGFEAYRAKEFRDFNLIKRIGGLALDISHWGLAEATNQKTFEANESLIKRFPIVINHLGGLKKNPKGEDDLHFINNPQKNFEFLNSIPKKIISPHIFLEIGNSIEKQMEIRDYLYKKYFD